MSDAIIQVDGLKKSYPMGRETLHVLRGVKLHVNRGEFLAVVGASGSGKSTLLHLMGLLDRQDQGTITIDGRDVGQLSSHERNVMRRRDIGFVFQFYHLLPELNVLENVMIAQMTGVSTLGWIGRAAEARSRAVQLLSSLGLSGRLRHRPKELSGGERQRVAIARALVNDPKVLLADEPTGNLDSKTSSEILSVIRGLNREQGQTVVMVTHDASLAGQADRTLHLRDGRLV